MSDQPLVPLDFFALVRAAAVEFGLSDTFMFDLAQEKDDWSFVVKAHALLESMVRETLLEHVRDAQLYDELSKLDLRRKRRIRTHVGCGDVRHSSRRFCLCR